jgi:homoserine O-acetyltransferase
MGGESPADHARLRGDDADGENISLGGAGDRDGAFLPDCAEAHLWFEKIHAQNRTNAFDAHDYLYQSWAYEAHDVGTTAGFEGDTEAALASIKAKTLILAAPLDLFNPVEAARAAAAKIPGAQFIEIPSLQGHQAATSLKIEDEAFLNRVIREFLAQHARG